MSAMTWVFESPFPHQIMKRNDDFIIPFYALTRDDGCSLTSLLILIKIKPIATNEKSRQSKHQKGCPRLEGNCLGLSGIPLGSWAKNAPSLALTDVENSLE